MSTKRDPRAPCRPNEPPSLHEQLIRKLIESDERICRNGFWRAIAELTAELGEEGPCSRQTFRFDPDAYRIDRHTREIFLYEVEHYGRLSDKKLRNLAVFWEWWDSSGEHDWLPRLFLIDRFGNRNEINLEERAYA